MAIEARAWMSNYILLSHVNIINYSCPKQDLKMQIEICWRKTGLSTVLLFWFFPPNSKEVEVLCSVNGLAPTWCQAISRGSADLLSEYMHF